MSKNPNFLDNMNHSDILIVDDTLPNLQTLSALLEREGYIVRAAVDGESALMMSQAHPPGLVLLDIRMPGMDGFEVCRRMKALPNMADVPVIFLSALNDISDKVEAFSSGGVDYVTKPFQIEEVLARVATHVRLWELTKHLEDLVAQRTRALESSYDETIKGWAKAMELRDHETEGHCQRVVQLTERIARALGIEEEELVHIRRGAMLHDIGKIGVPDEILLKPGPLTPQEWEIMRQHPRYSCQFLEGIDFLIPAMDIPRYHHEHWDGGGYNTGLKGTEIPLAARIFCVVDVWDALTNDRPYRKKLSFEEAASYIRSQAGKLFDPALVDVFLKLILDEDFSEGF